MAGPLGVSVERAAWGVHEVINEDVAKAFRVHASERGVDYRRCSMIVFGGSGPMHGVRVARKLRIPRVVCPSGAGVMSAFGLLASPVGFELVQSLRVPLAALTGERFAQITGDLESRVRAQLASAGVDLALSHTLLRLDMRYEGQGYEVEVRLPPLPAAQAVAELPARFADAYATIFGMSFADRAIEIVAWKVRGAGTGAGCGGRLSASHHGARGLRAARPACRVFAGDEVRSRNARSTTATALRAGATIDGPRADRGSRVDLRARARRHRDHRRRAQPDHRHRRCTRMSVDVISLGIQWDRLISIADEIINSLVRTSFSTNVRESYDLSCVVFDGRGRSIAQGAYSVPSFTGTAPATLAAMLARFPAGYAAARRRRS